MKVRAVAGMLAGACTLGFLSNALGTSVPAVCEGVGFVPPNGATNVATDVSINAWSGSCGLKGLPTLKEEGGQDVPSSIDGFDYAITVRPLAPLARDKTYILDLGLPTPEGCGAPGSFTRFYTGPAPAVREVFFRPLNYPSYGELPVKPEDQIAMVKVMLSENVSRAEDLLPSAGYVTVELADGKSLAIRQDSTPVAPDTAYLSFKVPGFAPESLPRADLPLRIRVKKELAFASGASLPGDLDEVITPSDFPYGWSPGIRKDRCPKVQHGCGCSSTEEDKAFPLWTLIAALTVAAKRRCRDSL